MLCHRRSVIAIAVCAGWLVHASCGPAAVADEQPTPEGLQFFEAKIRPVLIEQCYRCHSADGQGLRGGLSVDSRDGLRAGGESGPAIVPGDLEQSVLWDAINHGNLQMPPRQKLSAEIINDFREWILMGAPDPRSSTAEVVRSRVTPEEIAAGREFWSFRPPVMPDVATPATAAGDPQGASGTWAKGVIDQLVLAKLREHDLQPAADADAQTLLRRLHFDVVGLPPAPDAVRRFTAEWSQDPDAAIAAEVDRLLASPQFGERWGRHWLDVARYAESTGKEIDLSFPNAWRYRDYVIDAFNSDKPYAEFIQEQIAGDLLPARSDAEWAEHLIATGFLALGPKAIIEQNPRQFHADLIDEQIDTTTRVILGVSVACARCHDHKFDPIPQTDYYALAGIFESTETFFGGSRSQRNRQPSQLLILPLDDPNPSDQPLSRQEVAELKAQRDQAERDAMEARRAQRQPAVPGRNEPRRNLANQFVLDQQIARLSNRINGVDENGRPLTLCMGVQPADQPRNARVLVRGEIDQPAQEVPRGLVQVLSASPVVIPADSTGRLELARWLSSRDNPLTARVMANRIWQHLLGAAIVREPENFGASGPAPTHPELLDYLAIQFMDDNWSVKSLIRRIATSRVYRLSSQFDEARFEKDPDNLYLSRANTRRLTAEAVRDAMLAASGQLDLQRPRGSMLAAFGSTIIGPDGPVQPVLSMTPQPGAAGGRRNQLPGTQLLAARLGAGQRTTSLFDTPVYYRSVYLPVARNSLPRVLEVFDFAEPSMVIGQRETSNTPAQGLYMLNNQFVIEQSDALARRLLREAETAEERLDLAFQLVYGRSPAEAERRSSQAFVRSATRAAGDTSGTGRARSQDEQRFRAYSEFCQALFAAAEFRYLN